MKFKRINHRYCQAMSQSLLLYSYIYVYYIAIPQIVNIQGYVKNYEFKKWGRG